MAKQPSFRLAPRHFPQNKRYYCPPPRRGLVNRPGRGCCMKAAAEAR